MITDSLYFRHYWALNDKHHIKYLRNIPKIYLLLNQIYQLLGWVKHTDIQTYGHSLAEILTPPRGSAEKMLKFTLWITESESWLMPFSEHFLEY